MIAKKGYWNAFSEKLISLFSNRSASVFVLSFSVLGKILHKFLFMNPDSDRLHQIQATKNLLEGKGITIATVNPENISEVIYQPLVNWPPAYSVLLAPFYRTNGDAFLWGTVWPDLIAAGLLVVIARKILLLSAIPIWLANVFTVCMSFFPYEFITTSSTDLLSVTFFLCGIYYVLLILRSEDQKKWKYCAGVAIMFLLACMFRYAYIPVVLATAGYLLASGYLNNRRNILISGTRALFLLLFTVALWLIIQKSASGQAVYLYPLERGIYFDNLLHLWPFLYAAAGNAGPPVLLFQSVSGIRYAILHRIVLYSHIILTAVLLFLSSRYIILQRMKAKNFLQHFFYITFICCVAHLGLLAYLSVTYAPLPLKDGTFWTYVLEGRYFSACVVLLQLLFFIYISGNERWKKPFFSAVLIFFVFSSVHAFVYAAKNIGSGRLDFKSKPEVSLLLQKKPVIDRFVRENNNRHKVCFSSEEGYRNLAFLWGDMPGSDRVDLLNTGNLKASRETAILVAILPEEKGRLSDLLSNSRTKFFASTEECDFYSILLK